ncbi:putative non-specific serine/threonine protein kinase [Helianthus annuus]|nr:putative non-specific serine/threonine protein kinase [Helianthus annuus]
MKKWIFSLLDNDWNAKLLDFGVARLGPQEGFTHISTKVCFYNCLLYIELTWCVSSVEKSMFLSWAAILTLKRVLVD